MVQLQIRGVDIDFPFQPYDCQVSYMEKVIHCLQEVSQKYSYDWHPCWRESCSSKEQITGNDSRAWLLINCYFNSYIIVSLKFMRLSRYRDQVTT